MEICPEVYQCIHLFSRHPLRTHGTDGAIEKLVLTTKHVNHADTDLVQILTSTVILKISDTGLSLIAID